MVTLLRQYGAFTGLLCLLLIAAGNVWRRATLDQHFSVEFPTATPPRTYGDQLLFAGETNRCRFRASTQPVPAGYRLKALRDATTFLTGVGNSTVKAGGGQLISTRSFVRGTASGREIVYQVPDSVSGTPQLHREQLFVMRHALYRFECWFLKEPNARAETDAEHFFGSIEVRN